MNEIRALLRLAGTRLEVSAFLRHAHLVAIVLGSLALVLMLADRVGPTSFVPWLWVAPALIVVGGLVAALLWSRRRRSDIQVAIAVDERLELREKLSTALHCRRREDPFARAAVEDAVLVARDPRTREATKRTFSVAAPGGWWISPLIVLVAIMVSMLDPLDLFSREQQTEDAVRLEQARIEAETSVEAIVREIKENPALQNDLEDLLGELTSDGFDPDTARDPEQVRREAIKKVTEINKRLEEILSGEDGKTAEALQRSLSQLRTPQDGEAKELADALQRGDFAEAQKALADLQAKLEAGALTEEAKQAAAEQLQQIAEQLQQLAQQQQQLQQALQQAGLDPQLAQNPAALQQALQNADNLNQQQKQQLQQMAQAQQAAQQMCQGLGQAAQQMAQQMMQQGQQGQQGQNQGAQQMAQQLSQMEQLQQMLQQAQAAMNQCQGQCKGLGQGLNQAMQQQGGGMGQRGQGQGGKAPIAPTPWGRRIVKADTQLDPDGDIIARMLVDGPQYVGESRKTASQVVADIVEGFDDAQTEEQVPRKYQDAHKHFFGELQKMTEATDAPKADAPAEGN